MAASAYKLSEPGWHGDMLFEKDIEMPARNAVTIKANVYRLVVASNSIVLTSWGPYGKNLPKSDTDPFKSQLCVEPGPLMLSCAYVDRKCLCCRAPDVRINSI